MLVAFGCKFKNEIPPLFIKQAQYDLEMKMDEGSDKFKSNSVDIDKNWQNLYNLVNKNKPHVNVNFDLTINDKKKCLNKLIYNEPNYNYDNQAYGMRRRSSPVYFSAKMCYQNLATAVTSKFFQFQFFDNNHLWTKIIFFVELLFLTRFVKKR